MKTVVRTVFFILCLSLFGACGDLDTVLPTYNTYQISALLNNHIQLEEYSLVQENDSLRPYCDRSIASDPDIRGLQVVFQNSRKETLDGRVRYVLNLPESGLPDDEAQEPGFPDAYFPDSFFPLADFQTSDMPDTGSQSEGERVFQKGEETVQEPETAEEISEEENEQAPEETVQAELIKIGNDEIVFNVDRLDELPAFGLPDDLRIGSYTMIIRVLGEYAILGEVELSFYYMGNAKLSLKDIAMYLPGFSSESRLIPPGTTVLLEAKVEADTRLNPYIVWYNGKNVIKEGRLSEGAGFILWQAPEQNGFQSLRAELLPSRNRERIKGIHREIILPVSAKAVRADFISGQTLIDFSETIPDPEDETEDAVPAAPLRASLSDMMHWYQFAATLKDSRNPLLGEKAVNPKIEKEPRWAPLTHSYGLTTGPNDIYELPPLTFVKKSEEQGGGLFLFRIKPTSDGTVLYATLASAESSEQVTMELSVAEGYLSLLLSSAEGAAGKISVPIGNESDHPVVTAALLFYIFPEYFEARLITEKFPAGRVASTRIRVSGLLDGQCRVSLGKADTPNAEDSETEAEDRENGERYRRQNKSENTPVSAVWDQLAVLYMPAPEPSEPDIETAAEEAAAEADAGAVAEAVAQIAAVGDKTDNSGQTAAETDAHTNPEPAEPEDEDTETVTAQDEAEDAEPPVIFSVMLPEDLLTDVPDTL